MLHLKPDHQKQICDLAKNTFSVKIEIWAYGSRVNGDSHDASDLDLVIKTHNLKPLPIDELMLFKTKLKESNIPILVQVLDWARLPENFHKNILKNYFILYPEKI